MLWHKNDNKRTMPWKGEKDPYKVWLSEIILQQTRVEQGLDYYNKFVAKYPNISILAGATDEEVFKMWEGLGYYSRCKNLIETARYIAFDCKGIFPKNYNDVITLKGVGPYTAAAIVSFAYNLPNAVVDGNVLRVLARYFGNNMPIDSNTGKKYYAELAQTLLDKAFPASYNQAIMDFGATICKPKSPLCEACVLKKACVAYKNDWVGNLPVKGNKLVKRKRFIYYIIATHNGKIYVRKRVEKDIWQNLWEFIAVETSEKMTVETFLKSPSCIKLLGKKPHIERISNFYKQQLTHQTIEGVFIHAKLNLPLANDTFSPVTKKEMLKLAFPRFITNYFETGVQIK
jgi:A/G-specific adenine glycosylase